MNVDYNVGQINRLCIILKENNNFLGVYGKYHTQIHNFLRLIQYTVYSAPCTGLCLLENTSVTKRIFKATALSEFTCHRLGKF